MDCIRIKRLEVFAKHGAIPEENVLGQKFLISVGLYCDLREAGLTDDLERSVSYAAAAEFIKKRTEENTFRLIERLAEYLAQEILLQFPSIQKVEIEVEKPWAPVLLPLETVSVSLTRQWHTVYLSLGSNMGDRKMELDRAVKSLSEDEQTQVEVVSSYIETKPVGGVEQDDFLNAAARIRTLRTPQELLRLIGKIEAEQKRERIIRWGPRTIDIDILLYDDQTIYTEDLCIPHIEMENRMFVLEPMCQIAPYACHPGSGATMLQLKKQLQERIQSSCKDSI